MNVASVLESREPKDEIEITLQWKEQRTKDIKPMLGPVQLCQLSGLKQFLFTAGCLINKNVLKLEAGILEKIRTF